MVSRRRGRPKRIYPQIEREIRRVVKKYPGASTFEVSERANISWSTSKKYLGRLERKKAVRSRKVGKKRIWF